MAAEARRRKSLVQQVHAAGEQWGKWLVPLHPTALTLRSLTEAGENEDGGRNGRESKRKMEEEEQERRAGSWMK